MRLGKALGWLDTLSCPTCTQSNSRAFQWPMASCARECKRHAQLCCCQPETQQWRTLPSTTGCLQETQRCSANGSCGWPVSGWQQNFCQVGGLLFNWQCMPCHGSCCMQYSGQQAVREVQLFPNRAAPKLGQHNQALQPGMCCTLSQHAIAHCTLCGSPVQHRLLLQAFFAAPD
jgi:hypothetical protein